MPPKRTSGMAALASTHILLGGLGALAYIGALFAAVIVAVAPSILYVSKLPFHVTAEDFARSRSAAIGIAILFFGRVVLSVVLVVAGIRVLDVAPAGRRLSLVAAYGWTLVN